jgi:HPt (histidine-containing phosphotransfer) domain-containing protein
MDGETGGPIADEARFWLRVLGDPAGTDEVRRLVRSFIADGTSRAAGLQVAATAGDLSRVRWLAHDLLGSSATFGAHLVAAICRRALELAEADDLDAVRVAVAPIDTVMAAAADALADEFLADDAGVTPPSGE